MDVADRPLHTDADGGRAAVPEVAELLHLQRPAASVVAAVVVLVALLASLVAPGVLPPSWLTGLVVGLVAVLAAVGAAVALDGRDPVLRGPRHLRRDGHRVMARMEGPDATEHGAPVLAALLRRLEGREHLSVLLTGAGADCGDLAVALGRGAAGADHPALVVDLRAAGAPGIAEVARGRVRLAEAAELADDRPYAWIPGGAERAGAISGTIEVAQRPPRDLDLLLVVTPESATLEAGLLEACDHSVLVVAADRSQRAMVTARMDALRRAGARPEAIIVGGVRVDPDGSTAITDLAARWAGVRSAEPDASRTDDAFRPPERADEARTDDAFRAPQRDDEPTATVPTPTPEPAPTPRPSPQPSPTPDPIPRPDPDPTPTPEPDPAPRPAPDPEPAPTPQPEPEPQPTDVEDHAEDTGDDRAGGAGPSSSTQRRDARPGPGLDETGEIPAVRVDDTHLDGMTDVDDLSAVAALEQLSSDRGWGEDRP